MRPIANCALCIGVLLFSASALAPRSLPAQDAGLCEFRMPIQDAFTISGGKLVLTGRVESGSVKTGQFVRVPMARGEAVSRPVEGIEEFAKLKPGAASGEMVGIMVSEVPLKDVDGKGILRGDCRQKAAEAARNDTTAPPPENDALPVRYYGGIRTTTSPDGKKFLGASEALIKRLFDKPNGTITETVLDEGRLKVITLRQTDHPNVFSVDPGDGAWSGTLTFAPDAWQAAEWTYDLKRKDGTAIEGTGKDNGQALLIETYVVGVDGERQVKIVQRLPEINVVTYEAKHKALVR